MEVSIWQEFKDRGLQVIGISNEPESTILKFIEDQGITFPVLRDMTGTYSKYNIPGGQSPYPRDFIIDKHGVIQFAKTEYDPGSMITIIDELLLDNSTVSVTEPVIL
ncbi:MAG: redoxin domain-containing protein, partial [Candidatus Heimdallarchaeota archaeon]|nr:redoxin domain-containing protein [Candidatus Heimdallarchaeota archaeon]